nr:hypothetical protein [Tanacetum cinerariifolium]
METLIVETPIPTVSLPVPTAYSIDSQEPSSDARLISKRVANQVETPSLDNILSLSNRFEDILGVTINSDESNGVEADISNMEIAITASPTPTLRIHKDHPKIQIIGLVDTLIQTKNKSKEKIYDALQDPSLVEATQEELLQFKIQNVWTLVDWPKREEGIDYDEVFAPVARIEAIRLFLAYASFMGFTVYYMDVKSAFLYGTIDEEVKHREDFILVQVYVDDIIFGSSNPQLCREFKALVHEKFKMSVMDVRSSNTPMDKENPWGKDRTGKDVDLHLYRSMTRSLMYLTASRPDIMFTVCACARHQNMLQMLAAMDKFCRFRCSCLIMEAGSKDRPPMLAPGNYVQWKSRIKRYIDTKPNHELIHYCLENPPYKLGWKDTEVPTSEGSLVTRTERVNETEKNVSQDIRDQLNAEAEAVQIILTGIDNDIYSTVDACPNACEMWKATERFYKMMNELIRNQCKVTNHQVNVQLLLQLQPEWQRSQQAATKNRGKAIVYSPQPIYDQEPSMVAEDDETSKDKEIDKLMALISLSFKKIYKPNNNNVRTSSNTSRTNQDNSPRINRSAGYENQRNGNVAGARETVARECQKPKRPKDATYHREKMLLCKQEEAGIQLNAEQANWRDDTDDDELEDQELEAHYMYMVSNDDHYNVFAMESTHPEQSKSVHDTYPIEQDAQNVIIDSLNMTYDRVEMDQNDDDNDLAKEQANNKLSETNNLLYADYKKSEAELAR